VKKYAVSLTVLVLAASGCSGGVEGPVIEGNRSTSGDDAEVLGEVVLEGDCLYLDWSELDRRQYETGTRFPVIWPHGTDWNADELAVVLPSGNLVHEGDQVEGSGGYYHGDALSNYTVPEGVALALSCVDNEYGEVAVFNTRGDIEITP
jgi:hypothetical protein